MMLCYFFHFTLIRTRSPIVVIQSEISFAKLKIPLNSFLNENFHNASSLNDSGAETSLISALS